MDWSLRFCMDWGFSSIRFDISREIEMSLFQATITFSSSVCTFRNSLYFSIKFRYCVIDRQLWSSPEYCQILSHKSVQTLWSINWDIVNSASQISVILIDRYPLMEEGFGRLNMNFRYLSTFSLTAISVVLDSRRDLTVPVVLQPVQLARTSCP
jgi:hypothetical protein